jgi:hypothetical protein
MLLVARCMSLVSKAGVEGTFSWTKWTSGQVHEIH